MKAGRSSYDCGDVSVTTARSAGSKNCYKKARKWDRVNLLNIWGNKARTCSVFSWQDNLMVSTRFLSLWSPR